MTAINIVARPDDNAIYLLTDAAVYSKADGIAAFHSKTYTVPNWPGAVVSNGNANAGLILSYAMAQTFSGADVAFDTFVATANHTLPEYLEGTDFPGGGEIILCGLSRERKRLEVYSFRLDDTLPDGVTPDEVEEAVKAGFYAERPGQLLELPDVVMTPVPPAQMSIDANYAGIKPGDTEEQIIWTMRKHMAMQRHMPPEKNISGIGGFATLTKISLDGITQRVVDRWPEDRIGGRLTPPPIDWRAWHAENPRPV